MKILGSSLAFFSKPAENKQNNSYVQSNPARLKTLTKDTVSFSGASEAAKSAISLSRKTIKDLPLNLDFKRVFLKVDHNLPAGDNTRMVATLPTIKELLLRNAKLVIGTHIGDPFKLKDGQMGKKVSTKANAEMLQELLRKEKGFENVEVIHSPKVTGLAVEEATRRLKPRQILYLENLRFNPAETGKNAVETEQKGIFQSVKVSEVEKDAHARDLANLADIYVNDAFGAAHRDHASVSGITKHIQGPKVAGLLMNNEIKELEKALKSPKEGFVAIVGGSKVSSKIPILSKLLDKVQTLIVGGGMAHTFTAAEGGKIGKSLVEKEHFDAVRKIQEKAQEKGVKLVLPTDAVGAIEFKNDTITRVVEADNIPDGMMGLDIGPKSIKAITDALKGAKTILWNGPVGVFEMERFSKGTKAVGEAVANVTAGNKAISIIGGGDTGKAIKQLGLPADKFTHISTGGGASLEMIEKEGNLPGISTLDIKGPRVIKG